MKLMQGLLILAFVICFTRAYPASEQSRHPDDDAEIVQVVPIDDRKVEDRDVYNHELDSDRDIYNHETDTDRDIFTYETTPEVTSTEFNNFDGVVDTGYVHPGYWTFPTFSLNPYQWNFNIFDRFHDMFRALREQAASTWSRVPTVSLWPEDITKDGNTTSTVKVVDGHKVVINDTVYSKKTDLGETFIKVRTIDVKPLDNDATTLEPVDVHEIEPVHVNPNAETDDDDDEVGSPEVLEINQHDNEINHEIDDAVEVIHSSASPTL